jgi:cytidylate kinase
MTLVTLSASYGAGGSRVGPELAKRLDVPFVDRVIASEAAANMAVPLEAALRGDDVTSSRLFSRLLMSLAPIGDAYGAGTGSDAPREPSIAEAAERAVIERADSGRGVILGRAAAVVLRNDPRVTHVRLDGPREARLEQAMRIQGIDRETAEERMQATDEARHGYVRQFRRADARDPSLYHLIIDSTALDLDTCMELIALAAAARAVAAAARERDPSEAPT